MALRESTQRVIQKVESLTGLPVHLIEDASLPGDATIGIGNPGRPIHVLKYKPAQGLDPDYFIAYQCGFAIRLHQAPPEKRFDFAPTDKGIAKVTSLVGGDSDRLRDMLLDGLGTQLRSVPIGLRIDGWIASEAPELKDLQELAVRKQLGENTKLLDGALKKASPAKIYEANLSMVTACAAYWARRLSDNRLLLPFKLAGFLDRGQRLLAIFDKASPDPADDPALVDAWAFELGIKGWYRWVPREAAGR